MRRIGSFPPDSSCLRRIIQQARQSQVFLLKSSYRNRPEIRFLSHSEQPQERSSRPRRIILLRHGESVGNVNQKAYVTIPDWKVPLTQVGLKQSFLAGKELQQLIGDHERIIVYHSPYKRTTQTATELLKHFTSEQVISVREEPRISEQQWGNYQNEAVVLQARNERHQFGRFYYRFPSGESGLDVYSRVSSFISTLIRDCQQYNKAGFDLNTTNIIIVTHGLALRLFLMRWFQFNVEDFEQSKNPQNAALIVMNKKLVGQFKWYELDPSHREALNLPQGCGIPRNVRFHHLDQEPCPHFVDSGMDASRYKSGEMTIKRIVLIYIVVAGIHIPPAKDMALDSAETSYYHFDHRCDLSNSDFAIKVTLRRVTRDGIHAPCIERNIRWQEKIIGPKELIQRVNNDSRTPGLKDVSSDPRTRVGEIYVTNDTDNLIPTGECDGMTIYTYVDKDFFSSVDETMNLNTCPVTATHITTGIRALPIHSLHTKESLSPSAAGRVHDRLSREDPVQFMNIVAMVDLETQRHDSVESNYGLNSGHEKLLCRLALHKNGILEVQPKFSQPKRGKYVTDCNIFVDDDTLNFWDTHGIPLTTYNFHSSSGSQYQYSIQLSQIDVIYDSLVDARMENSSNNKVYGNASGEVVKHGNDRLKKIETGNKHLMIEISTADKFKLRSSHFSSSKDTRMCVQFDAVSLLEKQSKIEIHSSGETQSSTCKHYHGTFSIPASYRLFAICILLELIFIIQVDWRLLLLFIGLFSLVMDLSVGLDFNQNTSYSAVNLNAFHFGHSISLSIPSADLDSLHRLCLFIQVINKTRIFETLRGIGFIHLPTKPGHYNINLSTIMPMGHRNNKGIINSLNDYYFGRPKMSLTDLISTLVPNVNTTDGLPVDRHSWITEYSGSVLIQVQVM